MAKNNNEVHAEHCPSKMLKVPELNLRPWLVLFRNYLFFEILPFLIPACIVSLQTVSSPLPSLECVYQTYCPWTSLHPPAIMTMTKRDVQSII